MTMLNRAVALAVSALLMGCQPSSNEPMTFQEEAEIAQAVGDLFAEVATATSNLQLHRLLDHYRESEDLTYVARGRVTRSFGPFSELFDAQFRGISGAQLEFSNEHIDVLSRNAVVVTAEFKFTATLETGDAGGSSGTFTCIYVLRDGAWKIQHSSHTFPANP